MTVKEDPLILAFAETGGSFLSFGERPEWRGLVGKGNEKEYHIDGTLSVLASIKSVHGIGGLHLHRGLLRCGR